MSGAPKEQTTGETLSRNEKKWTKAVLAAGWVAFPAIIVEKQKALGLSAVDINIILHLASYWWTEDKKPYPSKKTIAEALDIAPRTVQRHIAAMEAAKFIYREQRRTSQGGGDTNIYHLDGLIEAIKPFAEEKNKMKEQRKAENEQRKRSKLPKLRVVRPTGDNAA